MIVAGGLAVMVLSAQDDLDTVRQAADQGDAEAQYNLGNMYANGRGRPQGRCRSRALVPAGRRAGPRRVRNSTSGSGTPPVMGVLKDAAEAVRWFHLAAEQGDATAQFNLGFMYANGEGVPKDAAEAVRWYRLAAEQGLAIAQFNLGNMYANGRGVLKDDAEAVRWYRLAAEQGLAECAVQPRAHVRHRAGRPQGRCRSREMVPAGRRRPRQG